MTMLTKVQTAVSLDDVAMFGWRMLGSKDIDPVYPVLQYILEYHDLKGLKDERGLWLTVLYVAFYNLPSALTAFRWVPMMPIEDECISAWNLPIGIERRGLRGGKISKHLMDYWERVRAVGNGSVYKQRRFLREGWSGNETPEQRYLKFWDQWQTVWGNGRWSAFKMAEILETVHGFQMQAPDMRLEFCSGPREGLIWLYGLQENTSTEDLNRWGLHLRRQLGDRGVPLTWEELETILCNFNSMRQGKYYVGHDVDEMQSQIQTAEHLHPDDKALLWAARQQVVPREYLGETNGWSGIQKGRMKAYKDRGEIVVR